MKKSFIAISMLILLASCSVTEKLSLNNTKGGTSSSDIHVEQFFVDVLEDFAEFLPTSDKSIMDEAMEGFARDLSGKSSTSSVNFEKTGTNSYSLSLEYSNLLDLVSEMGADKQTLISMESNSLRFYVDIDNFDELTKIVPFLADPNFEVYGPLYNQGTTEEDYLDMIFYLLGEDGPDAIKSGIVSIDVSVPGRITSVEGATRISNSTARFTFPIIDFLLLNKPLTFTINWR